MVITLSQVLARGTFHIVLGNQHESDDKDLPLEIGTASLFLLVKCFTSFIFLTVDFQRHSHVYLFIYLFIHLFIIIIISSSSSSSSSSSIFFAEFSTEAKYFDQSKSLVSSQANLCSSQLKVIN